MNILPMNNNNNNTGFGSFIIQRNNFEKFLKPNPNVCKTPDSQIQTITKSDIAKILNKFKKYGRTFKNSRHIDVIANSLELCIKPKCTEYCYFNPTFDLAGTRMRDCFCFSYSCKNGQGDSNEHTYELSGLTKKQTEKFTKKINKADTQMDKVAIIAEALELHFENNRKKNPATKKLLENVPVIFTNQIKKLLDKYGC